ncbi:MAG: hypothetical protein AAFQ88_07600 [Pseudomonadota bacterium]
MTPTTFAEKKVLNELETGLDIVFGEGPLEDRLPPAEAGPDRQVRASFVRWLAMGSDGAPTLHAKGLRIVGALITNDGPAGAETPGLDLEGAVLKHDLALIACRFHAPILLRNARLQSLFLNHAHIPGSAPGTPAANWALTADRLETRGGVFLRDARCEGEVRLLGARIGGNLDSDGATLTNPNGNALSGSRLEARGDVFLRGARCEGAVHLLGARIGGDLACTGATLTNPNGDTLSADGLHTRGGVFLSGARCEGAVSLPGARIKGDLACNGATLSRPGGDALVASSAEVGGILFWIGEMTVEGAVDLRAASFKAIYDHRACWPKPGELGLDRCAYGAFVGNGVPVSANARIDWLGRQYAKGDGQEFRPQPWEQCAKVLREMGHREDARLILIDKERRLRADAARRGQRGWLLRAADRVLDVTIAYGHRPLRALLFLAILWFIGADVFRAAWHMDQFKPNNAFVLRAPEWVMCDPKLEDGRDMASGKDVARPEGWSADTSQLKCFLEQPEARDFPKFNAGIYAFDVLFPLVDVEQQANWIPDPACAGEAKWSMLPSSRDCVGWWAKAFVYVLILAGWGLSLLAVAGFSGLVKSD